jgi:hypothetical protein
MMSQGNECSFGWWPGKILLAWCDILTICRCVKRFNYQHTDIFYQLLPFLNYKPEILAVSRGVA